MRLTRYQQSCDCSWMFNYTSSLIFEKEKHVSWAACGWALLACLSHLRWCKVCHARLLVTLWCLCNQHNDLWGLTCHLKGECAWQSSDCSRVRMLPIAIVFVNTSVAPSSHISTGSRFQRVCGHEIWARMSLRLRIHCQSLQLRTMHMLKCTSKKEK